MALDLLAGSVVFQIPHRPNARLNIRMGIHRWESSIFIALEIFTGMPSLHLLSGPACGVVAGSKIPNYCVMSDTSNVARVMEKMGEGMRISVVTNSKI